MPRKVTPLSDYKVKGTKPQTKDVKLSDGDGLYLLVTPKGGKLWYFKYRFEGKEKKLAFGSYPEVSLADARDKREQARKNVANGVDPSALKKAVKAARIAVAENSFEVTAIEWHTRFSSSWSPSHALTTLRRLKADVFPVLGAKPVNEINAVDVLTMLRRIESRGALETAHRIRGICSQVFRYAVATGRVDRDPTPDLKNALPPYKKGHHPAIVDPSELTPLLQAIDVYQGSFVVMCALRLSPLFFVRPGELRHAEWCEFDFDSGLWSIPADRMKMKISHIVPLSTQAVIILKDLKQLTGTGKYLFPCNRSVDRCMSNNSINAALRRMGFDKETMTSHGFRATARTILDEVLNVRPDFIEHQLAHAVRDANGRAYNRTSHLDGRREMMQTWADYLDGLKSGKNCKNES